ncbi:hypothetical protein GOP47_0027410 [Adiantum capillus-veneris]|nr:hypothetical protein GOP47_0027410 [Adiantum capillus-veneris]
MVLLHCTARNGHSTGANPAFFLEKLKATAPIMGRLTVEMTNKWGCHVEGKEAIDVAEEFRNLTADIIAHTAFGSSFAEGKLVFELQHKQQDLIGKLKASLYIPGSRFLPTSRNRYRKNLNSKIREVLGQIIRKRMELGDIVRGDGYGDDLLGLMLAANKGELLGNQKKRLREEVFEVCGKTELPTADALNHLKLVGMVMNETLRLYPPVPAIFREADQDMKLGQTLAPAGTVIVVPIIAWHHDERYWGPDATEFHPERFEQGSLKACKVPGAYLPFSYGPRNCIGQLFASIDTKMVLATILQRYHFQLSNQYVHAPTVVLTTRPQFGMPIVFESLQ